MDNRKMLTLIVYSAMVAAAYFVITLITAPISFGPLQLRIAGTLMPLCLYDKRFCASLALGTLLANLMSPFGFYDFIIMPICVYLLTRWVASMDDVPLFGLLVLSASMACCILFFPLHLGGGIAISWQVWLGLMISLMLVYVPGYYIVSYAVYMAYKWGATPPQPPREAKRSTPSHDYRDS